MNSDLLLSPTFSKKLPQNFNSDSSSNNQEDIFSIDVDSYIVSEQNRDEENDNVVIKNSYSESGDIFTNENLCQKLQCLYNEKFKCQNAK